MFGCRSWAESGHAMTVKPDAASRSQWAVVCFFITSYVFFITPTPGPGNTVLTSIKPEIQTTSLGRRDKSTKNRSIRHVAAPEILPRPTVSFPVCDLFSCSFLSVLLKFLSQRRKILSLRQVSSSKHQCGVLLLAFPGILVSLFYHLITGRLSQLHEALFQRRAIVAPHLASPQAHHGFSQP